MSFDFSQPQPPTPRTYEESLVELPQRPRPQISLRFLVGLTTLSAVLFTMIKLAMAGNRFAQVATLLVCLAIGTLISFAMTYTVGMILTDRAWRSKRTPDAPPRPEPPSQSIGKGIELLLAIAVATCTTATDLRADVDWQIYDATPLGYDFSLSLGTEPMPGPGGYRTFHIRFTPRSRTFSQDHQLELTMVSLCHYNANLAAATSASFALHQGDGKTEHTLLVPSFGTTDEFRLEVVEDRRRVNENPVQVHLNKQGGVFMDQGMTIGILHPSVLGNQAMFPDVRSIVTVFGSTQGIPGPLPENASKHRLSSEDALLLASGVQPSFVQFRVLDQLPLHPNWLALSDLDVMLVHQDFWTNAAVEEASRESLLRWVAAGGSLWSYGETPAKAFSGSRFKVSAAVADLPASRVSDRRQLTDQLGLNELNDTTSLDHQWRGKYVKQSSHSGSSTMKVRKDVFADLEAANNPIAGIESVNDIAARIHVTEYGLGKVIVIDDADPFPGSLQLWTAIRDWSQAVDGSSSWIDRFGLDYRSGNTNYWRWLIDSVGGPPVRSFLLLNTIFMLLVGPIAYFSLRRFDKLYLLYFIAPAAALLISSGLFVFAIISEGLGTKLRTHQWTWVDLVNEAETQQDRSTYYSALGAGELRFPSDVLVSVVMPIGSVDYSQYTHSDRFPGGRVKWTDAGQVWSGDFVPARSQIQYQITRPVIQTPPRLTFATATDSSATVTVTNHSNASIGPLAYCDANGDYHHIDQVAAGQSQAMRTSSQKEATALIDSRVLPPAGFVPNVQGSNAHFYNSSPPTDPTPILERRLAKWRQGFPKATFVGITQCDASRFAIDAPDVSSSLQIIMGRTE